MQLQGIFSHPLLWLLKLPLRALVAPFMALFILVAGRITMPGGIVCRPPSAGFGLWFITLPIRFTLGTIIVVFLVVFGDVDL